MNYYLAKYKKYAARIVAAVLVFGITFVVWSHFRSTYDTFLPGSPTDGQTPGIGNTDETTADTTGSANGNSTTDAETSGNTPDADLPVSSIQEKNIVGVINTALLSNAHKTIPAADTLSGEGYLDSAEVWDNDTMQLGKISFPMDLPESYSVSMMEKEKVEYRYPDDIGEITAVTVTEQVERPVLSVYMGYMMYDNGEGIQLLYKNGKPLMSFDDSVYIPGYTRDKYGQPLFYRWLWDAEKGMVKVWYALSYDGSSFVPSEYDDERDGRGLYFDYPSSYGLSDNTSLERVWEDEEALETRLKEDADSRQEADEEWQKWYDTLKDETKRNTVFTEKQREDRAKEINSPVYEKPYIAYFKNGTDLTGHIFMDAFHFKSGLSAVTENTDRGALYFIDEYGRKVMGQGQTYYMKSYERYVMSSYRMPVSFGIESIGSFYMDHGLVRVRKQIIDYSGLVVYNVIRVIIDEDVLLDRHGKEMPLPAGYVLRAYNDGMILLEKNGRFGYMDYTGNWIAEPIFSDAEPFVSGLAVLTTMDGRVGMIDTEGNIVLPFAYEYISQASSGLVTAYDSELGWQAYRIMKK